jgi:hypothetical protein
MDKKRKDSLNGYHEELLYLKKHILAMIKNKWILILACCFFIAKDAYTQQQGFIENIYKWIEDHGKFALKQEAGHISLVPYASVQEAIENKRDKCSGFLSLNGLWSRYR